jgi:hypothetical protein
VSPRPTAAVAPLTINTQSKLAAKDAKRTRKPHSATSDADDEDAASPHGGASQALAAGRRGKDHYGDGGHGAGGGGVKAEIDAPPEGTTADTTQHVLDSPADFDGKIQLEGPPVHRWVDLNSGGKVLVAIKWRWDRTDTSDALLSVHIGSGVCLDLVFGGGWGGQERESAHARARARERERAKEGERRGGGERERERGREREGERL